MKQIRRSGRTIVAAGTLGAAVAMLLALPAGSIGQGPVDVLLQDVRHTVQGVTGGLLGGLNSPPSEPARRQVKPRGGTPGSPGGYQPPLHGTAPHGQGTIATADLATTNQRPLSGDPAGGGDQPQNREEVIVGRARGEQSGSSYHGHITLVSLLGMEVLGVDTRPGQSASGPLDAVQTGVLDAVCTGLQNQVCLDVLRADSTTTASGSTNHFAVANAQIGGATGIGATAAESHGTISEDANCQTAHGDSTVTNASIGGNSVASVAGSSSDSRSCNDGSGSQTATSSVIGLGGQGVPLPAAGCGNGTGDTVTGLPPLAPIVCNGDDNGGVGESLVQAAARYGVREALTVFTLDAGDTALLKATTGASESRSQAPGSDGDGDGGGGGDDGDGGDGDDGPGDEGEDDGGPGGPRTGAAGPGGPGPGAPQCSDGIDNDGDGQIDFPNDRECESRADDSESGALPFTGQSLLLIALLGSFALIIGLSLRQATARSAQSRG